MRHLCVSTPYAHRRPPLGAGLPLDPAEQVALVARAKREALLRTHRHRLRGEDLEDCFSQATLELLISVRAGRRFAGRAHVANALELRFLSRVQDRRRALSGRSPLCAALEQALPLGIGVEHEVEVADPRAEVDVHVAQRLELELIVELAEDLTSDQRLALAGQLSGVQRVELCDRLGWSVDKYRKVGQRGRARLRELLQTRQATPHRVSRGFTRPGERTVSPTLADGRSRG